MSGEPRAQRYWDDVSTGEDLEGFTFTLDWTTLAKQVSGSQDFHKVHHDFEFAREGGHETIFYNTGFTRGWLGRLLTDWMGPEGWIKTFGFQMRRMNTPGDEVSVRGRVTGKAEGDDPETGIVDLDIWIENTREGVTTPGTASVLLPRRTGSAN